MDENIAHLQQLKAEAVQRLKSRCCLSCKARRGLTNDLLLLDGGIDVLTQLKSKGYVLVRAEEHQQLVEVEKKYSAIRAECEAFLKG